MSGSTVPQSCKFASKKKNVLVKQHQKELVALLQLIINVQEKDVVVVQLVNGLEKQNVIIHQLNVPFKLEKEDTNNLLKEFVVEEKNVIHKLDGVLKLQWLQ